MIRHSVSSNSGYKSSLSTYSWSHTQADLADPKQLYGLLVGIAIYHPSVTVTSITITTGGNTRNLSVLSAVILNNLRSEIWTIPDILPDAHEIEITLSGAANSSAIASTYAFLGNIGRNTTAFATDTTGLGITSPLLLEHSIMYANLVSSALTGIVDTAIGQARRGTVESASGTHLVSDVGPVSPLPDPEDGTEVSFDGGVSDDFTMSYLELLYNNRLAHAIG